MPSYLLPPGADPNMYPYNTAEWQDAALSGVGNGISMSTYPFTSPMGGGTITPPIDFPSIPGPVIPGTNAPGGNPCNIPGIPGTVAGNLLGCGVGAGLTPVQTPYPGGTMVVQSAAACVPGYTLRKTPKRCASRYGECVPKRHMNSLNPHALRRATRRLSGFFSHVKSAEKAVRHSLGHVARTSTRRGCNYCGKAGRSCKCG